MEKEEKHKTSQLILSGMGIIVFGILIFSNQKLKKENSRLRGENETLTKERMILTEQIKKDWYHIGKIITSKIKIKR
jgi:cell division protein FtsB